LIDWITGEEMKRMYCTYHHPYAEQQSPQDDPLQVYKPPLREEQEPSFVITRAVVEDETLEDIREDVVEVFKVVVEVVIEIEIELEMVGFCAALLLVNSLLNFSQRL
jgi:hypothetical protein